MFAKKNWHNYLVVICHK